MAGRLRPGVLFDLDGTLVDTNYLHTLAWWRAFRDAGEWRLMNAIHRLIGMGGDLLVPELLGHDSPEATSSRPRRYKELMDEARRSRAPPTSCAGRTTSAWPSSWPHRRPTTNSKAALQVLGAGAPLTARPPPTMSRAQSPRRRSSKRP